MNLMLKRNLIILCSILVVFLFVSSSTAVGVVQGKHSTSLKDNSEERLEKLDLDAGLLEKTK